MSGGGVLRVKPAAEYVGVAARTLYNLKSKGEGPTAHKNGRLTVYYPADLDEWLKARLVKEGDTK
ncbi:helix-turn-helix transcriptional regulator [Plantibacter sp. YIM 135249]|uniref:helix-turn-helix transcriptional regulator n=1 Tax=Plantibacter sp. YIM 135249 TaxID=3423918 RepID=UPI003D33447F